MPLQPITEKDLNLVRKWRNSPSVRANMYSSHEITEKEHLEWFELMQLDTKSLWFMHYSQESEPDGVIYFTQYDEVSKTAFWGFYTDPSSKPGAGLRLGLDALNYAFLDLKLHKLNSDTLGKNISSK
jgi:UDP-4-amino-4,6-dideoxy-N-acetyl-beta-L-altrosamine N-acetyltransferase